MTTVIAICGSMGSGKSTLVDYAKAALPDCVSLKEDDFHHTMERSLDDMDAWWQRGAEIAEFDLSLVAEQLSQLCPGRFELDSSPEATAPARKQSQRQSPAPEFVLFESQFGRLHPELLPWIDLQFWLDVPADLAVVRKLLQFTTDLQRNSQTVNAADGLAWIAGFCGSYLTTTRKFFEMQRTHVRSCSDRIIDGTGSPFEVCSRFLAGLPMNRSC